MSRRSKSKVLPPTAESLKRKRERQDQLHDGRFNRGMSPPNHMMPQEETPAAMVKELNLQPQFRWPLAGAVRRGDTHNLSVFVHERYGVTHYSEWADQPPTWMDPHLLLDMAEKDAGFKAAVAKAFKQNDVKAYRAVEVELQRVFENVYLPWIIEQFATQHTVGLIAEWVTNREVQKRLDTPGTGRRKKPKA